MEITKNNTIDKKDAELAIELMLMSALLRKGVIDDEIFRIAEKELRAEAAGKGELKETESA